jgi:hypothetical protein
LASSRKIAKGIKKVVKKVVKPIAKVAQFIPGPWQPIAALANKAFTVYDVAKGRANPLSLLTVAGPLATGGGLTKNIGDITKAGSGSFIKWNRQRLGWRWVWHNQWYW